MSYLIMMDGQLVSGGNRPDLTVLEPHLHMSEGNAGTFECKMPPDNVNYDLPKERKTQIQIYLHDSDTVPTWCGHVTRISYDFWMNKKIEAEGDLSCFADTVTQIDYSGMSASDLLITLIDSHNSDASSNSRFQVGDISVTGTLPEGAADYETTLDIIDNVLLDNCGGIIKIRYEKESGSIVRYVDYLNRSELGTSEQQIELGQNLLDLAINIEADDIATVILPLGEKTETTGSLPKYVHIGTVNNGRKYIQSSAGVENFGKIWKVVRYEKIKKPADLLKKAQDYLNNTQFANMIVKATAIDLSMAYEDFERFELSQKVKIISAYHDMNAYFWITEMDYYLEEPERNTVTCGHSGYRTLSGIVSGKRLNKLRTDSSGRQFYPSPNMGTEAATAGRSDDIRKENETLKIYRLKDTPVQSGDMIRIR